MAALAVQNNIDILDIEIIVFVVFTKHARNIHRGVVEIIVLNDKYEINRNSARLYSNIKKIITAEMRGAVSVMYPSYAQPSNP